MERSYINLDKLLRGKNLKIRKTPLATVEKFYCSASMVQCSSNYNVYGDAEEVKAFEEPAQCGPDETTKKVVKIRIKKGVVISNNSCEMGNNSYDETVIFFFY